MALIAQHEPGGFITRAYKRLREDLEADWAQEEQGTS